MISESVESSKSPAKISVIGAFLKKWYHQCRPITLDKKTLLHKDIR